MRSQIIGGLVCFRCCTRYWWVFILRGVLAIVFGAIAFAFPAITLAALIIVFGAYAFVDVVFLIVRAAMAWRKAEDHWLMLLEGLLGLLVGALTFLAPGITALGFLIYIAAWSLATGVLEIAGAIQLRKEIESEWWLLLSGILRSSSLCC